MEEEKGLDILKNSKILYVAVSGIAINEAIFTIPPKIEKKKRTARYITTASPAFFMATEKKEIMPAMSIYVHKLKSKLSIKFPKSAPVNGVA